jgi:hypothetical protein
VTNLSVNDYDVLKKSVRHGITKMQRSPELYMKPIREVHRSKKMRNINLRGLLESNPFKNLREEKMFFSSKPEALKHCKSIENFAIN